MAPFALYTLWEESISIDLASSLSLGEEFSTVWNHMKWNFVPFVIDLRDKVGNADLAPINGDFRV